MNNLSWKGVSAIVIIATTLFVLVTQGISTATILVALLAGSAYMSKIN